MTWRLCWLGCLFAGCVVSAPRALPAAREARPRCTLVANQLHCGPARVALADLGVARVRAAVPRAGGGLYLLAEAGELARVDARGELTAITPTPFVALHAVGSLVCALDATGAVSCLADHAGDARCGSRAPVAKPVRLPLSFRGFAHGEPGLLCGLVGPGQARCVSLSRRCDRACLQYPDCEQPLRCADPCRPGEAPLQFVQQPPDLG
jgi:hypothetical protein